MKKLFLLILLCASQSYSTETHHNLDQEIERILAPRNSVMTKYYENTKLLLIKSKNFLEEYESRCAKVRAENDLAIKPQLLSEIESYRQSSKIFLISTWKKNMCDLDGPLNIALLSEQISVDDYKSLLPLQDRIKFFQKYLASSVKHGKEHKKVYEEYSVEFNNLLTKLSSSNPLF